MTTVEQRDRQAAQAHMKEQFRQAHEQIRAAKIANGLDPDEALVTEAEIEGPIHDYRPTDWQNPEDQPDAELMDPPWEKFQEDHVQKNFPTILDLAVTYPSIRQWWDPQSQFHKLVAAKLIVMDELGEPERVEIDLEKLHQEPMPEQVNQLAKLNLVVAEVQQFQQIPPEQRNDLLSSLMEYAVEVNWTELQQQIAHHQKQQQSS